MSCVFEKKKGGSGMMGVSERGNIAKQNKNPYSFPPLVDNKRQSLTVGAFVQATT